MWQKSYRDYKLDEPLVKSKVEPGRGIVGCEMHELNGWGEEWHVVRKKTKKHRLLSRLQEGFLSFFKSSEKA
jgi:hypothetical protein